MSDLDEFMTDKVTLVKPNGQQYPNVGASVTTTKIIIADGTLPIEEGDILMRILPNGLAEEFHVIERGYYGEFAGQPPHYQATVEKRAAVARRNAHASSAVYNLYGTGSRVSINSTDNSTNVVNVNSETLFSELTAAIRSAVIAQEERERILAAVQAMSQAQPGPRFAEKYASFISLAANHMQLVGPFLPALMQLLMAAR